VRLIEVDGSPERVGELVDALAAALGGGPAVLPLAVGARPRAMQAPAGTAVVIATSGSTGEPKLVALSGAALRASARATEDRLGGPGRWLLALPAEHVAGIQVIVRALLAGASPVVMDLRTGFRPDAFAAATAALGPGRRYTSLVPTQLRRILDAEGAVAALRSYAAVLVGGAALDPATRERALAAGPDPFVDTRGGIGATLRSHQRPCRAWPSNVRDSRRRGQPSATARKSGGRHDEIAKYSGRGDGHGGRLRRATSKSAGGGP